VVGKPFCSTKISYLIIFLFAFFEPVLIFAKENKINAISKNIRDVNLENKISEKSATLDSIKKELELGREKLKILKQQEGSVIAQLEQLEINISTSQNYLTRISHKIDTTTHLISLLEIQLDSANKELQIRQQIMKKRLRAMYKAQIAGANNLLMSSQNLSQILHRAKYFSELGKYDRRLLSSIKSAKEKVGQNKERLEKERKKLLELKETKQLEYSALLNEQNEREKLLKEVRAQKENYIKMIKTLENAQKELEKIILSLEKKKNIRTTYEKSLNAAFESKKGFLPWPVNGKVTSKFGKVVHSVYKTVTMNTGIEISAKKGEKVICIASGKVVYIGTMRGLGNIVIVDHGGYYSAYAKLDVINVNINDDVKKGTILGNLGDSLGIEPPKLHFEIRREGEALDPEEWLEEKK